MRILRESNDYSQEYVADVLDIAQKTYSNLESGKSKLTLDRIHQLSKLYHVKPDYFLSEELPIVNYNTGDFSRSIIATKSYHEGHSGKFHQDIIKEKEVQISRLIEELAYIKKEKEELYSIIKELSVKIKHP
ncbi:helix-turn-helix transcriptional regulator [Algoriphagus sp. NG3]|uniref:helix-turn-helix domain-containing protein n=1 Tax=Algoriphagus sp. NG3 TaxID=3097546 RepID=UPI002A81C828|nr:helix-turn-helix transcriptional regulator [Algoriphagus sp. NG3]WPR77392.1 helix-turn-helix transcriptional regulator [Algoriphagus sp. NG3]